MSLKFIQPDETTGDAVVYLFFGKHNKRQRTIGSIEGEVVLGKDTLIVMVGLEGKEMCSY